MKTRISITKCKRRLATVWFTGSGTIFLIVFLQTLFGKFSSKATDAWGWFLPTVIPTLSLMVGVFVTDAMRDLDDRDIDPYIYRLAFMMSITYFAIAFATIALQPFTDIEPLELLKMSNLWLAPIQGLVAGVLGVFFVKSERNFSISTGKKTKVSQIQLQLNRQIESFVDDEITKIRNFIQAG